MAFEPDVKLDWAFYERKLGQDTSIRVGRIPQPMGLLNETRYVGTLLPFYRAPYNFYQEGCPPRRRWTAWPCAMPPRPRSRRRRALGLPEGSP